MQYVSKLEQVIHAVNLVPYGTNDFQGPEIKFVTSINMFFALVYVVSEISRSSKIKVTGTVLKNPICLQLTCCYQA